MSVGHTHDKCFHGAETFAVIWNSPWQLRLKGLAENFSLAGGDPCANAVISQAQDAAPIPASWLGRARSGQ